MNFYNLIERLDRWASSLTQADLDRIEKRFNNVLRYMIMGTVVFCVVALVIATLHNGLVIFQH